MRDRYGFERTRIDRVEVAEVVLVHVTHGEGVVGDESRHAVEVWQDGRRIAFGDPFTDEHVSPAVREEER